MPLQLSYAERKYQQLIRDSNWEPVFHHPGIYAITIDDCVSYVGKSNDMLRRLTEHEVDILKTTGHKYRIWSEAKRKGHRVSMRVLYMCDKTDPVEVEEDIGAKEAFYISQYNPPLNYQIPHLDNWREFSQNSQARTITLDETLNKLQIYAS